VLEAEALAVARRLAALDPAFSRSAERALRAAAHPPLAVGLAAQVQLARAIRP
jgi:hypothetical protein